MTHVIGIDIGSSSIKIGAANKEGNMTFVLKKSYSFTYLNEGRVELDLDEVWNKTKVLLHEAIRKISEIGSVDAISLSTFCNSSVFMDRNGNALCPGILYMDKRSKQEAEWIKSTIGERTLYEITRNRIEPGMYSVTTLLWMKQNHPEIFGKTYKWGNLSTYIYHKMTGEYIMDWTQASFSGIFDIKNYAWSKTLCKRLKVQTDILPEISQPGTRLGLYKGHPELPDSSIPVIVGGADTACSTLALDIKPNHVFESVGTSNVLTVCTSNPDNLDTKFLNRCHVIKDRWLSHGAMSTPGAAIRWFYESFLKETGESKEVLEELPKQSVVGANGLYFLPYMQGERTPIWDPEARGTFIGLHLNTSKADMVRAIMEGCAFGLRQIDEIIANSYGIDYESITSIGGGAKNRQWAQIKANVLNKKIEVQAVNETAVFGTCLLAGIGAGYYASFEEAQRVAQRKVVAAIEPEQEAVSQYSELYQLFLEIYPSLKPFFRKNGKLIENRAKARLNDMVNI